MKQLCFSFAESPVSLAIAKVFENRNNPKNIPMYSLVGEASIILLHQSCNNLDWEGCGRLLMNLEEQVRDCLRNNPGYTIVRGKTGGGVFKYPNPSTN